MPHIPEAEIPKKNCSVHCRTIRALYADDWEKLIFVQENLLIHSMQCSVGQSMLLEWSVTRLCCVWWEQYGIRDGFVQKKVKISVYHSRIMIGKYPKRWWNGPPLSSVNLDGIHAEQLQMSEALLQNTEYHCQSSLTSAWSASPHQWMC